MHIAGSTACVEVYFVNWEAINSVIWLVLRPVCCLFLIILYLMLG
jgi:hypothetical protein